MEDEHQHYIGKIAQKAVIENNGKILVCRGLKDEIWEFPGGRLHNDEIPQKGLAREILEELGISVSVDNPLHVCRSLFVRDNSYRILIAYRCSVLNGGEARIDETELEELRWVSREELATLAMFDDCREVADAFLKQAI